MCFIFVEILGFYMSMVKLCIYLCMYLLQVVLRPPQLGIESDLFLAKEDLFLAKEVIAHFFYQAITEKNFF